MSRYDIERFVRAQANVSSGYAVALGEVESGRKESHWIWYIFPQLRGLGHSAFSDYYGLADLDEARRYLSHPVLGPRLREVSQAMLRHVGTSADIVLSPVDALKLRSSMTLFDLVSPCDVFRQVLDAFFFGGQCQRTLQMTTSA